jgi:hypothetical protein
MGEIRNAYSLSESHNTRKEHLKDMGKAEGYYSKGYKNTGVKT